VNPDDLVTFRAAIRDELEKIKEFVGISGVSPCLRRITTAWTSRPSRCTRS
jgi:hypothetical protein